MSTTNNAAGRLLDILIRGRELPTNVAMYENWAHLLSVPKNDKALLLQRVGRVMELPSQIKDSLINIPEIRHEAYLRWAPKVEEAFSIINLDIHWSNFIQRIDDSVLFSLEMCEDTIQRYFPEKPAKNNDLNELLSAIDDLLSDVREDETINERLKAFILVHLLTIKHAIEEYEICGLEPIERAIESTIGGAVMHSEARPRMDSIAPLKRFWDIFTKALLVLQFVHSGFEVSADIHPILPLWPKEETDLPDDPLLNVG
ncbi:hypothetical protein D3C86_1275500 [compost metagenome]